ncbi:hypothetical protein ACLOJK_000872 [Asimina triloba]
MEAASRDVLAGINASKAVTWCPAATRCNISKIKWGSNVQQQLHMEQQHLVKSRAAIESFKAASRQKLCYKMRTNIRHEGREDPPIAHGADEREEGRSKVEGRIRLVLRDFACKESLPQVHLLSNRFEEVEFNNPNSFVSSYT